MNSRRQATTYFGTLLFFCGIGDPTGFISLPLLFILKDRLHAGPEAVAFFEVITLIPVYAAVVFGLLRDCWSPFNRRDRGYFVLAAPAAIACYIWLAAVPGSYTQLLCGITGAMIAFQMLDTATAALVTVVAQREGATGKLSSLSETVRTAVRIVAALAGGWAASHLTPRAIFLVAVALTLPVFVQALWSPVAVFPPSRHGEPQPELKSFRELFRKLLPERRRFGPVAIALLLHNFAPGWYTPLFYYLTETAHLSSEAFGACRAAQHIGTLLAAVGYGVLCGRVPMRKLLWMTLTLNIVPGFLYLLIRGAAGAIAVSAVTGLVSGFATVALWDLLLRSCTPGLEGAGTAIGFSTLSLSSAFGDLLGATVYRRGGFAMCLVLDALAAALILPMVGRLHDSAAPAAGPETAELAAYT